MAFILLGMHKVVQNNSEQNGAGVRHCQLVNVTRVQPQRIWPGRPTGHEQAHNVMIKKHDTSVLCLYYS